MMPNRFSQSHTPIRLEKFPSLSFRNDFPGDNFWFLSIHMGEQVKLSSPYGFALLENLVVRQREGTQGDLECVRGRGNTGEGLGRGVENQPRHNKNHTEISSTSWKAHTELKSPNSFTFMIPANRSYVWNQAEETEVRRNRPWAWPWSIRRHRSKSV